MPYADPEVSKAYHKEYRRKKRESGYKQKSYARFANRIKRDLSIDQLRTFAAGVLINFGGIN